MQIVQKINGIMAEVVKDNSEWCSDHLLVIMNEILHLAAELKKEKPDSQTPQKVFDQLLVNFKAFSKLLKASDVVSKLLDVLTLILVNRRRRKFQHVSFYPLLHGLRNCKEQLALPHRFSNGVHPSCLQAQQTNYRKEFAEEPLLGIDVGKEPTFTDSRERQTID